MHHLFGGGVLCHCFGPLAHGVLGQLSWKKEAHSGLNLATADGRLLVVLGEARGFTGDSLEDVVDKAVHDGHGPAGDTSVRVNLLEDFVDVDAVALLPFPVPLLATASARWLHCFLRSFLSDLTCWSHDERKFSGVF